MSADRIALREKVQRLLLEESSRAGAAPSDHRVETYRRVSRLLSEHAPALDEVERSMLERQITDAVVGLGPLEPLLRDPTVDEVMVNGPSTVYVERLGRIEKTDLDLENGAAVLHLIDRVVGPLGLRIDASRPWIDARLPDGSRVHAIIPPLAIGGPVLTIRKFARDPLSIERLVEMGALTKAMATFLRSCVRAKTNIVVCGGAGTGKTTLLNGLSSFIPESERVITIEDAAELRLQQPHVVALETRPANVEGAGAVGMRELVRNALRMRPDRIVVGEVRGGEAFDMLQAMNTGHRGSMSTVHANSPRDLISRLEAMVLTADVALPIAAVRAQIAAVLDLIVHLERMSPVRRVAEIAHVRSGADGGIETVPLVRWDRRAHRATGSLPRFLHRLREAGEPRPELFEAGESA